MGFRGLWVIKVMGYEGVNCSIHVSCRDTEKRRETHSELIILDIRSKVSCAGQRMVVNEKNGTKGNLDSVGSRAGIGRRGGNSKSGTF